MHDELPFVHSTLSSNMRSIAENDELTPQHCNVFDEPLLYFFYGRPSYRSRIGTMPNTTIPFCPVCFILKGNRLPAPPARIYPFDSGAAKSDRFDPPVNSSDVDNFELDLSFEAIRKFTNRFFETNGEYFFGNPRREVFIPPDAESARQYYELVTIEGETEHDDRRSAIEIQYRENIKLRDRLWAVVLPLSLMEDGELRHKIVTEWGAYPITYSTTKGMAPSSYSATIRVLYEKWLQIGGMI
ncbi:hypothetical protein Pla110_22230 [Polystyrenella longa]|uniref:Uncharacterized protein n=2 Tax=Polystyrenella longa TaxID=2528007 RepID=A0A518CMQ6_9PLAN|nr:hypothetical protein Pla110_22230 [Polystyrenella longa]